MLVSDQKRRVKPRVLQPGDTVGIIAPASDFKRTELEAGCSVLRALGYKPIYFNSIFDRDLYFAGSPERRARELEEMFVREDVRAILCARGGYGTNYLLPELAPPKIIPNHKVFVGYSDITTLLTHFCDRAGFVTFHGPMVAKDFAHSDGVDLPSWHAAMSGTSEWEIGDDSGIEPLMDGSAEGILYGGCLSLLAASLGTPQEICTRETILFLEDVNTKPFQIDRMLMQLKLAGKFEAVRGIVFGEMLGCVQPGGQNYSLKEVVVRVVEDLGVPIAFGLRSGHVSRRNITLPLGIRAALKVNTDSASLKILEAATAPVSIPTHSK
jgi:muramoyltetrapeptide carboxypeptidase